MTLKFNANNTILFLVYHCFCSGLREKTNMLVFILRLYEELYLVLYSTSMNMIYHIFFSHNSSRLWDRFQMIPRERVSTSDTFRPFLRLFKVLCYTLLFCIVLGSAVAAKTSILLMTSSIVKVRIFLKLVMYSHKYIKRN